jgi:hypothetical protein
MTVSTTITIFPMQVDRAARYSGKRVALFSEEFIHQVSRCFDTKLQRDHYIGLLEKLFLLTKVAPLAGNA